MSLADLRAAHLDEGQANAATYRYIAELEADHRRLQKFHREALMAIKAAKAIGFAAKATS